MGFPRARVGFGGFFAAVGVALLIWAFISALNILGRSLGPGEIFSSVIALGVMFAIAVFLTTKGASMLR